MTLKFSLTKERGQAAAPVVTGNLSQPQKKHRWLKKTTTAFNLAKGKNARQQPATKTITGHRPYKLAESTATEAAKYWWKTGASTRRRPFPLAFLLAKGVPIDQPVDYLTTMLKFSVTKERGQAAAPCGVRQLVAASGKTPLAQKNNDDF